MKKAQAGYLLLLSCWIMLALKLQLGDLQVSPSPLFANGWSYSLGTAPWNKVTLTTERHHRTSFRHAFSRNPEKTLK